MSVPLIATAFITRNTGILEETCSLSSKSTNYLFHNQDCSAFDTGSKSVACGRRVDSLKTWLTWKLLGDKGYETAIDSMFSLARLIIDLLSLSSI